MVHAGIVAQQRVGTVDGRQGWSRRGCRRRLACSLYRSQKKNNVSENESQRFCDF